MIAMIAAMTRKRVIGKEGRIPWDIPEEMALFRRITSKGTVIMGRKTFESVGMLKGRENIVLSRKAKRMGGAKVCNNLEDALKLARTYGRDIFIIGGAEVFGEALGIADRLYLSYIKKEYEGDAFFPRFETGKWIVERRKDYRDFEQVVYSRK